MPLSVRWLLSSLNRERLELSARTALAAVASLLLARLLRLPEAYWAPITAVVVTTRAAPAWRIGVNRFIEVAVGILVGLLVTVVWPERVGGELTKNLRG